MIDEKELLAWLEEMRDADINRSSSAESRADKEYWFGRAGAFLEVVYRVRETAWEQKEGQ